ncbi:autophagy protein 5 [Polyrhizophydium stewartii]|uniref:Autophagy protein 5 n=1 Tax=Polyrhizophydium stewartii TaxID=2732419 RepID=A0ABR4NFH0_9FUNG
MSDTAATWRGAVPLAITAGSSVFYVRAPAHSKAPFLSGRLRQDMTVADSDVWFDAEGTALRWQYPVGLLFDLHTARARARDELVPVPWAITAHFGSWPSDRLIPVDADGAGPNTPRSYFMSMIKEADFLRTGSTKKVMSLSLQDQTRLWDSLVANTPIVWLALNAAYPDGFLHIVVAQASDASQ